MENLKKLVAKQSFKNCDDILVLLEDELKDKVKELKVFGNETKIFLAGINTKLYDIEPIVLSGHIDTVSANIELYNTNPYELTEIDGKGFGLGSIDMKSFTAVVMDKLREIKKASCPIVLALTTDEETNLKSIELMIEIFKQLNIKPKFTIVGEPTKSQFNLSANACYEYKVKFYGKACHSSRPFDGVNAICACAKLISFIEEDQKKYALTSNCGVISGGEVINKVPDFAELAFDIRSINQSDVLGFLSDINNYIDLLEKEYNGLKIDVCETLAMPAFNMIKNAKINNIAKKLKINIGEFSGACEAGYYTNYCGDAVIFGVGDMALAHKPNEYVEIEEYKAYSNKLIKVIDRVKEYYFK